jgi:tetratricopeptide (TPR) repeat protein
MKKYTFIVMLIFSLIACGTSPNVKSDNAKLIMEAQASPTKNEDARFAYNKGTKLLEENRLKEAEKYLLEAIRLDPLFIDAIDHLGIVYRRQQRPEEAIKMYLKSIDINAYNSVPYINLGLIYMNQNLYEKSIEYYSKVIEFEPENSESYYGLGELYQNI